jgi:bifunctional UDP-N-acetylglucosamine pyrophosphorylase/glucosamine-1-phosphate N-acetyltransferase
MKAIILASGSGIRFLPLSEKKPKPLFKIMGKTILEHNLDALDGVTSEVIIVIGYLGEKIREELGEEYKGIKITYIEDKEIAGTGRTAQIACSLIDDEKVIIMNGDDIYKKEDIKELIKSFPSMLVKKVENPRSFGVIVCENDKVVDIEEKPENPKTNLANIGVYYLPKSLFNESIEKSARGEYEITDYLKKLDELYFKEAQFWSPSSYSFDVLKSMQDLFINFPFKKKGEVEKGATIKGNICLGEGSIIKAGTYIEGDVYIGKNCSIGPNAYLRKNVVLEDNVSIGQAVEIKNSIVGENTKINHLSYIGDSVIGSNCNLGAGTITANLRHDNENIKTLIKDNLVDTKLRKLGVITGDNVKTGINTVIYPGRKIYSNKCTNPLEEVKKDLL